MQHDHARARRPYLRLGAELAVDFAIMYFVMYTMIDGLGHLHLNLNNVYMTLMMVAPMAVVMLVAMPGMFPSRRANLAIVLAAGLVFAGAFLGMRQQTAIGDSEFLRAMIPHHSGALLMCREAPVSDPRIVDLCRRIIGSQVAEIGEMEEILASLD